jgi:lipoate-protein ligase A
VSARRSQTLWHALAHGVSAGAPPTLSFMRPARPYVGLGYHRLAAEVDLDWCREAGLPVYRRKAGGGVVYLDDNQLFFQITAPAASLPPARHAALRQLLAPAVAAWRAAGIDATLDPGGEVVVGEAPGGSGGSPGVNGGSGGAPGVNGGSGGSPGVKICGHAAAQIGDAVVVVGNLIERFDHDAAARVLALPPDARAEAARLMRRFVAATPADPATFQSAAVAAYGEALGLEPVPGSMTGEERRHLTHLDTRFATAGWLAGSVAGRPLPAARTVKIRAGVFVVTAEAAAARLMAGVVGDRVERAVLAAPEWNGAATHLAADLEGLSLPEVRGRLAGAGAAGARLADALAGLRVTAA